MAKVQRIPLGRKPGQRRVELREEIQISLAELADRTKQGLLAFAVGVGLEVFHTLLAEDVAQVVGPKGRHLPERSAYRHSTERSSVALGGRRAGVDKPRVRTLAGEEITLPTWAAFSGEELLSEMATSGCSLGCRPAATGWAWSRSATWMGRGRPSPRCPAGSCSAPAQRSAG